VFEVALGVAALEHRVEQADEPGLVVAGDLVAGLLVGGHRLQDVDELLDVARHHGVVRAMDLAPQLHCVHRVSSTMSARPSSRSCSAISA